MGEDVLFEELDAAVAAGWARIRRGAFWAHVLDRGMDKDLYVRTMAEIYHYTRHNSVNQAFAAWRVPPEEMALLRFCYHHADEELGHEKMVVHDLESIGVAADETLAAPPLPATQALIGYLYGVGLFEGAVARLGYSYWAERSYEHLAEPLARARGDLGLTDRQMTFFVAHQSIDTKHAEEVQRAVSRFVRTSEQRQQVVGVASTTLYLTGRILEDVLEAHLGAPA